jgi:hypothetical protein
VKSWFSRCFSLLLHQFHRSVILHPISEVENTATRTEEGMITAVNSSEGRIKPEKQIPCWDSNWKPLRAATAKSWKHGGGALCLDLLERELWMWQCERTDLRSALVFCFGTKLIFIDVMMMWCGRWNFEILMPSCLPHSSQGCTDWPHSGSKLHLVSLHTALTVKRYPTETEYVFVSGRFRSL